jgi:choline dehydrogenase-like flavoprotein
MLIDAKELDADSVIEADVVIAGGGIAGIALARQLGDAGMQVAVLESGGEAPETRTQSLYSGRMTLSGPGNEARELDDYMISSRVRCFGGSGNAWGGKCAPLDPVDFAARDWVPHSGWPVSRATLQPFYDRASVLLGLPSFGSEPDAMFGTADPLLGKRSATLAIRPRCYSACSGLSPDGSYATYKKTAAEHARVKVYLHANVTSICMKASGRHVDALQVTELDGRKHTARGRLYILAAGGIENVRLLLASNDVHRAGIGNHSDWLGRAFQGHTVISQDDDSPELSLLRAASELGRYNNQQRATPHAVIGLSDAAQLRHKTVNFTATLTEPDDDADARPVVAALAQRLCGAPAATRRNAYFMIEHTPNRDSRLTLLPDQRDELGMPRVRLDMRYGEIEFETFGSMVERFAAELGRLEVGRLRWSGRRDRLVASMSSPSRHHMGATRMARSPRDGVVDEHCRVHGVDNLFVAGSSVFPTSGIANPTLTLLALAVRLGDRLVPELQGPL